MKNNSKMIPEANPNENPSQEFESVWKQLEFIKPKDPIYLDHKFGLLKYQIKRYQRRRMMMRVSAAAMILGAVLAGAIYWNQSSQELRTSVAQPRNLACVTISDGEQVLKIDSESAVIEENDSMMQLRGTEKTVASRQTLLAKNTNLQIYVPEGIQFDLTLEDGTQVWFNSDTKMIYPSKFDRNQRRVVVEGEAYFQVAKDTKRPFVVSVNGKYDVQVVGTEFNVESYPGNRYNRTTLVKGKVAIRIPKSSQEIDLLPTQQIRMDANHKVTVMEVNPDDFLSWRERRLVFIDEPLSEIALKIKRAYAIGVVVNERYKDLCFSGRISYDKGVEYLIKVLKETENINCSFKNNILSIGI